MPNKKISELNVNTKPTSLDVLPIVNAGETKQITLNNLSNAMNLGFIVRPRPIEIDVVLPENSDILYFGPIHMGVGYVLSVPLSTTLTIQ